MALPSAVTVASVAFVAAAGVGYVAVSAASAGSPPASTHAAQHSARHSDPAPAPVTAKPSKPVSKPQHQAPKHHPKPDAVPNVLVEVFNNSAIPGLAEQKAAVLQGAGWHVAAVDNWYGTIPANTVYYPPALHKDAVALAKVLHITRLHPAVAPMPFDRLTVIFTGS